MVSIRKREANRRNAQKSTGPRSPTGRTRASRNALKHGLAAASRDPGVASMLSELVNELLIEYETSQEVALELLAILEAEIDLLRARQIRAMLLQRLQGMIEDTLFKGDITTLLDHISRADRYERRALSRRKFAVRDLSRILREPALASVDDLHKLLSSQIAC
jgi:hypothetical protein